MLRLIHEISNFSDQLASLRPSIQCSLFILA